MNKHDYIISKMIDIFSNVNWSSKCDIDDTIKILKRFFLDYDNKFSLYTRVGIAGIIEKDNKVLLLKRIDDGTWCFPGGKLEKFEDFESCIIREIKEETNFDVINLSKIDKVTNDKFDKIHYITLYYKCNVDGEFHNNEPNKFSDVGWFDWNQLPDNLFLPTKNYLKN